MTKPLAQATCVWLSLSVRESGPIAGESFASLEHRRSHLLQQLRSGHEHEHEHVLEVCGWPRLGTAIVLYKDVVKYCSISLWPVLSKPVKACQSLSSLLLSRTERATTQESPAS